jgi:uncharacterized protein DUF551
MSNQEQKWISVKESGYPAKNLGVLVFIPAEDYHITAGMWDISEKWVLLDEYRVPECEVTHWMEMPDVPDEYKKEIQENIEIGKALKYLLLGKEIPDMIPPKTDSNPLAFYSPKHNP